MDEINELLTKTRESIHDIRTPLVVIKTGIELTKDFLLSICDKNYEQKDIEKYCCLLSNSLIEANSISQTLNELSLKLTNIAGNLDEK